MADGVEVLARVRAMLAGREVGKLTAGEAVAALEAWLAAHAAWLVVRRGSATDAAGSLAAEHGKLHPLHRLLVERFGGFLEVEIDRERWPHQRHRDGFRVLGVAPEHVACDLAIQLPRFHAAVDSALDLYERDAGKRKALQRARTMVPMFATLEGVTDTWIASARKVEGFADRRIARPPRLDEPDHPRVGAPFALVARLVGLERRIEEIAKWIEVASVVGRVEAVGFDARGQLRLEADPNVVMTIARLQERATLVVSGALADIPRSHGAIEPLFQRRMQEADAALHATTVFPSLVGVLWARVDLVLAGLCAEEVAFAIARVRHARERFATPGVAEFDEERRAFPAGIEACLRAARADAAGFAERLTALDRGAERPEVTCVGRMFPRVRWSFTPRAAGGFAGHAPLAHPAVWHGVSEDGGFRREAEMVCAGLTPARLEALMSAL